MKTHTANFISMKSLSMVIMLVLHISEFHGCVYEDYGILIYDVTIKYTDISEECII
jgi:hypothetical protein